LKRTASVFIIIAFAIITFYPFLFNTRVAIAEDAGYGINFVNHRIEVIYNGYVLINDTIEITGRISNSFLIGFPYKYGSHVLKCIAYNTTSIFPVSLNVPLNKHVGFYGAEINFPPGSPQNFTVVFVLSNNLLTASGTTYTLDFPAYPSLVKDAANCSVEIVLPEGAMDVTVTKDGEVVQALTFKKENLGAFTYSPANATFSLTGDKLQLFDIKELRREVRVNGLGEVEGSDSYYLTSKAPTTISTIEIILPPNASNPSAQDQFGRRMSEPVRVDEKTNRHRVTFTLPLESYESARFTVQYYLPSQVYIDAQEGTNSFNVTPLLFPYVNYYVEQASVTLILPEGARVLTLENTLIDSAYSISRSVFQEKITINRQGTSYLESVVPSENVLRIVYEYNPLWLSFRPTLWMWALAVVGCAVAVVWRRPKAPSRVPVPVVTVRLRPEYIRSFVNSYEEKRKIIFELGSLETMVRKGKIPRRRYKVQRRTLETRLNTLARNLAEFKERMRAAGGLYTDLMRQLEIAETEINEVEANIKSIETRHSQGELSLEAYRKLLADYQRRKERAQTTIHGILLRLREEIR